MIHIVFLLVALACGSDAHIKCVYHAPSANEVVTGVRLDPMPPGAASARRFRRSASGAHRLNIEPVYAASFNAEADAAELKAKIVEPAIQFWESTLSVKTSPSRIRLSRFCNSANVTYSKERGSSSPAQFYCNEGCSKKSICGHTEIPASHLAKCREMKNGSPVMTGVEGAGVDADFVLYISAYSSRSCESSILGYAAHCQQEVTLDRPIAGYINFCPGKLSTALGSLQQSLFTAQHEILHALGFAISLYAYFRDAKGDPLTPRQPTSNAPALGFLPDSYIYQWSSNVTANRTWSWENRYGTSSKEVTLLVLPNVVREARTHFNCPSIEGVELEDQGENGVRLTHWEKRVLENELMTATYTHEHVISNLTLAFMQDTGWYEVNYAQGQPLAWGKNLGCDFVKRSCLSWMRSHPKDPSPYCTDIGKSGSSISTTTCTVGRRSVGYCVLERYTANLPQLYQYFTSLPEVPTADLGLYGGGVHLADYCPFVQGFNWRSGEKATRTTDCKNQLNNAALRTSNTGLQVHGKNSTCLVTDSNWRVSWCNRFSILTTFGSGCYEYECSAIYGLVVKLNGRSYQCLSEDQILAFSETSTYFLHRGGIKCPKCSELCGTICPSSPSKLREPTGSNVVPCVTASSTMKPHHFLVFLSLIVTAPVVLGVIAL